MDVRVRDFAQRPARVPLADHETSDPKRWLGFAAGNSWSTAAPATSPDDSADLANSGHDREQSPAGHRLADVAIFPPEVSRAPAVAGSPALTIQRQPAAPVDASAPTDAAAPAAPLPKFSADKFQSMEPNFDTTYTPVGPVPAVGTLEIILKINITFADFTKAMMRQEPYKSFKFTKDQKADFKWKDAEKQKFSNDFQSSVQTAWSDQHPLHLKDPAFSEYKAHVQVKVQIVDDPSKAHNKMTAQKVPAGAPRFRSFVSGDASTLDIRDPSETETSVDRSKDYIRQVGPFEFDSDEKTSEIESQLKEIEHDLRPLQQPGQESKGLGEDWNVSFVGRASAKGNKKYNEKLGQRRAKTIESALSTTMGWPDLGQSRSEGAEHASDDPKFQRVDVAALNLARDRPDLVQNTAAHEAGHMFGLDDEYIEEDAPKDVQAKFLGDKPSHFGDVEAALGTDAANEMLNDDSGSIMSTGGTVKRGHYVYFLEAINRSTSKKWTVDE